MIAPTLATVNELKAETVLRVSAEELAKLKGLTGDLQIVMEKLVGTAGEIDGAGVKSLQSLDYIHQSLSALSAVLKDASDHAPSEWDFHALNGVNNLTLADLRERFTNNLPEGEQGLSDDQYDYFL